MKHLKPAILTFASLLLLSNISIAQNLDSLYNRFTEHSRSGYIEAGNAILDAMQDTTRLSPELSYDQAHSLVLRYYIDWYRRTENYVARVAYLQKAVPLYEEQRDSMNLAGCYHTLGTSYQYLGAFDKAIDAYTKSGDILKAMGGDAFMVRYRYILNNVAAMYFERGDLDTSEELYKRCLELLNNEGSPEQSALDRSYYLGNLCQLYSRRAVSADVLDRGALISKALESGIEALELCEKYEGPVEDLVQRKIALARAWVYAGDRPEAEKLLNQAIKAIDPEKSGHLLAKAYGAYAELEEGRGNVARAVSYIDDAVELAEANGYDDLTIELLTSCYQMLRTTNPAKALASLERIDELKEDVFNDRQELLASEFQVKYETLEKEQEIERMTSAARVKNLWLLILLLLTVAGVALSFIFNRLKNVERKRNILLDETNRTKDKLFSIISHDLKNPAIAQRNALKGLVDNEDRIDADMRKMYHGELLKSAESQVSLVENLLNWARAQTGRLNYTPSLFNLNDLVSDIVRTQAGAASAKSISINQAVPAEMSVYCDKNMMGTAIRNILSNAIKYTAEGGRIDISSAVLDAKHVALSIKDNGVGMAKEDIDRFNEGRQIDSKKGTKGELGTGLGLTVVKEFIEHNGGKVKVDSTIGEGTVFTIEMKTSNES